MEPTPASSDEQVMWQVHAAGDTGAFTELARRWQQPLQRLCMRFTGDVHLAEDLAQEALAQAYARRATYRPGGTFGAWLRRIAINLCHDNHRRRRARPEGWLVEDGTTGHDADGVPAGMATAAGAWPMAGEQRPDEALLAGERAQIVREALHRLPESCRAVVLLRHYEGLRFAEIAEVLDLPEGTVKSRMADALDRLGRRLRPALMSEQDPVRPPAGLPRKSHMP